MQRIYNYIVDVLKRRPSKKYTIALVGQTGSGKTSFLNLLCNIPKVESLLVSESFSAANIQSIVGMNKNELEQEQETKMASKTSDAAFYHIPIVIGEDPVTLEVLDTPGFGDTRGPTVDQKHVERIINSLKQADAVHAICVVVNGRESRSNATLRYVLSQLSSLLPKMSVANVIVILTNTSDPLEVNFDYHEVGRFFNTEILEQNVMNLENPFCKLEKARQKFGIIGIEKISNSLQKSFIEAANLFENLIKIIVSMDPVYTKLFGELHDLKKGIDREVFNLWNIYQQQQDYEKSIKETEDRMKAAKSTKDLNSMFTKSIKTEIWTTEVTARHNTLCGSPGCHSNCHIECSLDKTMDKEGFRSCGAIGSDGLCTSCKHSYKYHHHDEVKWVKVTRQEPQVNEEMKQQFNQAKTHEEKLNVAIVGLRAKITQSEETRASITSSLTVQLAKYKDLGIPRSYAKLVEYQRDVVTEYINSADAGDKNVANLRKLETSLNQQLQLALELKL